MHRKSFFNFQKNRISDTKGLLFLRFLLFLELQPLLFDFFRGNAFDHLVEPLLVQMLRGFPGLPVLDEDGVEFDEPLRLRDERLGVDASDCFVHGALLRLQNLAGLLAEDLVGADA